MLESGNKRHQDKFYHRLLVRFSMQNTQHFRSLLPSFIFWSKMATICMQGIGLAVAYAWNSLLVQILQYHGTNFSSRFGLFLYSIIVTLIAALGVVAVMTSRWMSEIEIEQDDSKISVEHRKPVSLVFERGQGLDW